MLTHNRFKTYFVFISSDLNKAQFYKMPYKDSPHDEIELALSFDYLNFFKPIENTEYYYIKKPNEGIFYSKLRVKTIILLEIK